MEILRFILFLATTVVLVKVCEDVLFNWKKDDTIDVVEEEKQEAFDPKDEPDDLTQIEGITQRMIPILDEAGYKTYNDIELANLVDLKRTIETSFPHVSESELKLWAKQASYAVQGRTEDLEKLKATIARARMSRKVQ